MECPVVDDKVKDRQHQQIPVEGKLSLTADQNVVEYSNSSKHSPGTKPSVKRNDSHAKEVTQKPDPRLPLKGWHLVVEMKYTSCCHHEPSKDHHHHQGRIGLPARPIDNEVGTDKCKWREDSCSGESVGAGHVGLLQPQSAKGEWGTGVHQDCCACHDTNQLAPRGEREKERQSNDARKDDRDNGDACFR